MACSSTGKRLALAADGRQSCDRKAKVLMRVVCTEVSRQYILMERKGFASMSISVE